MGFPERFLSWISISLRTATTRVSVNGVPGKRIEHARGLRQGDPLSPQLFVLAMEIATLLFKKASEAGLLAPIANCGPTQRLSVYADDVVLFIKPMVPDLMITREILSMFGEALGLRINYSKSSATLIRGGEEEEERVRGWLNCRIAPFPIKYLGL